MGRRNAIFLSLCLSLFAPTVVAGQSVALPRAEGSGSGPLRLANDPSKPLYVVGISGGFTGVQVEASVYGDGRVISVRHGAGRSKVPMETHVPVSREAVQVVLSAAVRSRVFAIPRRVQEAVFGADIPVLSLRFTTTRGIQSVHVTGGEGSHPAGSKAFFPIWSLLYAIAGYPPQVG